MKARACASVAVLAAAILSVPAVDAAPPQPTLVATDVVTAAGIAEVVNDAFGAPLVDDFNGDGISDLVLSRHNKASAEVYLGDADGTFAFLQLLDAPPPVAGWVSTDRHGCASGNFNSDGLRDIYCTNGANKGRQNDKSNELWLQNAAGRFDYVPGAGGADDKSGRGRSAVVADFDHNGVDDIFVVNGEPEIYASYDRMYLFLPSPLGAEARAKDGGAFGPKRAWGGCSASADVDADGWMDVYVCALKDQMMMNTRRPWGRSMRNRAEATGVAADSGRPQASGVTFADVDNDGDPDLVKTNRSGLYVMLNDGRGFFTTAYSLRTSTAWGVAAADVDLDGDLDLYVVRRGEPKTTTPNEPDILLLNNGTGTGFTRFSGLPQATGGYGSAVSVIPHYNERPAFVVTNGSGDGDDTGPRQLIAFTESTS